MALLGAWGGRHRGRGPWPAPAAIALVPLALVTHPVQLGLVTLLLSVGASVGGALVADRVPAPWRSRLNTGASLAIAAIGLGVGCRALA
jgi:hypothetical protein